LLVADGPADLVAAMVRCLRDASLRASLAAAGHARTHAEYGWDRIGDHLLQVMQMMDMESCATPPQSTRRPA
jgi:hypothetical protein